MAAYAELGLREWGMAALVPPGVGYEDRYREAMREFSLTTPTRSLNLLEPSRNRVAQRSNPNGNQSGPSTKRSPRLNQRTTPALIAATTRRIHPCRSPLELRRPSPCRAVRTGGHVSQMARRRMTYEQADDHAEPPDRQTLARALAHNSDVYPLFGVTSTVTLIR